MNWSFEVGISHQKLSLKDKFKRFVWQLFKWNLNYANYKLLTKFSINVIKGLIPESNID
jgi:hypothetical protein